MQLPAVVILNSDVFRSIAATSYLSCFLLGTAGWNETQFNRIDSPPGGSDMFADNTRYIIRTGDTEYRSETDESKLCVALISACSLPLRHQRVLSPIRAGRYWWEWLTWQWFVSCANVKSDISRKNCQTRLFMQCIVTIIYGPTYSHADTVRHWTQLWRALQKKYDVVGYCIRWKMQDVNRPRSKEVRQ